jgi:uncharacterized protein
MKNILIAGGTGLIGQKLSTTLKLEGYHVSYLSHRKNESSNVYSYYWNPTEELLPLDALEHQDIIINLAGTSIAGGRWTKRRKESILKSRINSTRLLVNSIIENHLKPSLLINASAIGFYGSRPEEKLDENSSMGSDFLSLVCSRWEQELLPLIKADIPYAILRFGLVFSRSGGILPMLMRPLKMKMAICFGQGNHYFSWIHIHDLVRCIIWLIEGKLIPGIYNCVAPDPFRQNQFYDITSDILGKKMMKLKVPVKILNFFLGESSALLISDQYVMPDQLTEQGFIFDFPEIKVALYDLIRDR